MHLPRPSAQPGFLLPLILVTAFVTDGTLRLTVPADRVSYRVWEAMRMFGGATPFRPLAHYNRPRVYGNLAALGNQPDLRRYHRVVFTTDSLGYHNPPGLAASGDVAALLFGSSFSAGTEMNDGEGLAPQLSRLVGRGVYNAAPADPVPSTVAALARRVGLDRGVVIYEYYSGIGPPPMHALPPQPESVRCRRLLGPFSTPGRCAALTRLLVRLRIPPLNVYAWRAIRMFRDDRWLPNPDGRRVARARLSTGDEMLFVAGEREFTLTERSEEPLAHYAGWLKAQLAEVGLTLLVVLVPEKYAVYASLLDDPTDPAPLPTTEFLARAERELNARGIPAVNVGPPLRDAARAALPEGRYVYWPDDTHWNAAGVRVAAEAIAPVLRTLLTRQPEAAIPRVPARSDAQYAAR